MAGFGQGVERDDVDLALALTGPPAADVCKLPLLVDLRSEIRFQRLAGEHLVLPQNELFQHVQLSQLHKALVRIDEAEVKAQIAVGDLPSGVAAFRPGEQRLPRFDHVELLLKVRQIRHGVLLDDGINFPLRGHSPGNQGKNGEIHPVVLSHFAYQHVLPVDQERGRHAGNVIDHFVFGHAAAFHEQEHILRHPARKHIQAKQVLAGIRGIEIPKDLFADGRGKRLQVDTGGRTTEQRLPRIPDLLHLAEERRIDGLQVLEFIDDQNEMFLLRIGHDLLEQVGKSGDLAEYPKAKTAFQVFLPRFAEQWLRAAACDR